MLPHKNVHEIDKTFRLGARAIMVSSSFHVDRGLPICLSQIASIASNFQGNFNSAKWRKTGKRFRRYCFKSFSTLFSIEWNFEKMVIQILSRQKIQSFVQDRLILMRGNKKCNWSVIHYDAEVDSLMISLAPRHFLQSVRHRLDGFVLRGWGYRARFRTKTLWGNLHEATKLPFRLRNP